jgi:5-(carboxyamino)imidazole ribonucleotide synthase
VDAVNQKDLKLCILGGGQLGKMLIEAASDWNIQCFVLDPDPHCSCAHLATEFTCGNFSDFDTVYNFCQKADKVTIEIEHVNAEALLLLQKEGKQIYPDPSALQIIQDKGKQKAFFEDNALPTSNFQIIETKDELLELLSEEKINFPFVQKSCKAGYDGKGVCVVRTKPDSRELLDGESVIEDLVEIDKELSVIAVRNSTGITLCFPPVEMEFHPTANLVEYLHAPAGISERHRQLAEDIAVKTITAFQITGILAVEMFLTKKGEILINEVAPRPHNSGHHTIEANYVSQYQQLLRCIFDIPLGATELRSPAIMVNLLGEAGYQGEAKYYGLKECLSMQGVYVHLYGKKMTKPFRKMGHVTILAENISAAKEKAKFIKDTLKVIA